MGYQTCFKIKNIIIINIIKWKYLLFGEFINI